MRKEEWVKKGYADEAIPEGVDLKAEIRRLCKNGLQRPMRILS